MNIQAVLDKVRKLRALSRSSNEHEAAAAAAAAERILVEHNLSEAQLETPAEETERPTQSDEPITWIEKRSPYWRKDLASRLANLHGCSGLYTWKIREGRYVKAYVVVGRPSDVATVRYLFAWLTAEIERLALANGKGQGRAWANSYRMGCVAGIHAAMHEAKRATQEATKQTAFATQGEAGLTSVCAAIVKVDSRWDEAQAERDRLFPNLKASRGHRGSVSSVGAYHQGVSDGRAIHTGGRIAGGAARALSAKGG